jgi:hypothetical protein
MASMVLWKGVSITRSFAHIAFTQVLKSRLPFGFCAVTAATEISGTS